MKRLKRPSTSHLVPAAGLMLAVGLGACQTLVTTPSLSERLVPLDRALTAKPSELESAAASGNGEAQFSLSLVLAYGLNGRAPDRVAADGWRRRAIASRRFVPITQYTAAFNGQPSRVNIINVPTYDVSPAQITATDACVALLGGRPSPIGACGDADEAAHRMALWETAQKR